MKRSEAVKLIHNIISDELLTTEEFNLNDCSELLKALEEAGMLPPPDLTDIRGAEKETGVVLDISYNNPLNDDYSLNLWEKE
jgi:hypothetical protein